MSWRARPLILLGLVPRALIYVQAARLAEAQPGPWNVLVLLAVLLVAEATVLRLTDRLTGIARWRRQRHSRSLQAVDGGREAMRSEQA
jgi:hypothetical protein